LAKGAAPNTPAGAARWLTSRIPLFSEFQIGAVMVLAPVELKEVSLGRSLAVDSGCSDRSHYLLAKGAAPNAVAGRALAEVADSSF
jgi:hypothetical protein